MKKSAVRLSVAFTLLLAACAPAVAGDEGKAVDVSALNASTNQGIIARVVVSTSLSEPATTYETRVPSIRACFEQTKILGDMVYNTKTYSAVNTMCLGEGNGEMLAAFRCRERECRQFK